MKKSVFKAAKNLRALHADAILLLPNSFRAALIARLARIPIRAGYTRDRRSWLLTDGVQVKQQQQPTPTSKYYLHLANMLFNTSEQLSLPTISASQRKPDVLNEFPSPIVLLVAGASKPQKRWAPERFAQVADALHAIGATCCAIGSPDEHELIQEIIASASSPIHDLTQSGITLGSLKNVVKHADLMITNDTGPRHLAVAVGIPTITLYGPTDYRWTKYECAHDIAFLADPFLPDTRSLLTVTPQRCNINQHSSKRCHCNCKSSFLLRRTQFWILPLELFGQYFERCFQNTINSNERQSQQVVAKRVQLLKSLEIQSMVASPNKYSSSNETRKMKSSSIPLAVITQATNASKNRNS